MNRDELAYIAITRLHHQYADVVTRRAWEELGNLALDDAVFSFDLGAGTILEFVGPQQLAHFGAGATAQFSFYEYFPLTTVVTVTGDTTATGRFYALEVGTDRTTGDWNEIYGVYDDDYRLHEERWRFARRAFRTLTHRTGGDRVDVGRIR